MPEPLKHMYSPEFIEKLSIDLQSVYKEFQVEEFQSQVLDHNWQSLELKGRMRHITLCLNEFLPDSYPDALDILIKLAPSVRMSEMGDFKYMFLPDYVEMYGLDEFKLSVEALAFFTCYASSEFAVRPFIIHYGQKMMDQMKQWSESDSHHIRRLASEGCRPRLPWAMALPEFKKNPEPILEILGNLKNDDSLFVRRSVANNLNDIAKDNESVVLNILTQWHGETGATDWIVKHGCRTLLKQGHPEVLGIFGFHPPEHIQIIDFKVAPLVNMGSHLEFEFQIVSEPDDLGKLRIEYAVGFMKANGKQADKVFKISESTYSGNRKQFDKRHSFKPISTRKYYAGAHSITIIVNGQKMVTGSFELAM